MQTLSPVRWIFPPGGLCVVNAVVVALAANGGYDGYEAFIEKK
ncbi:MAG: hypothetical protein ACOYIR_06610 [Christensenellales bacterium]